MVGRAVAGTALVLLFISLLTSAFTVKPAMASNPVYIRADGSIDPPESPISSIDNTTYTLTDNIYGSITIERDNIQVDVTGHTLQGTGSEKGIYLSSRNNVTIRNADIRGFEYGIFAWHCSSVTMIGNNLTANTADGISVWGSSNNTLMGNLAATNNVHGIYLLESSNSDLVNNTAIANKLYGVTVASSTNNILIGNNITANENDGITISASTSNTLTNNIIQGNGYNFGVYGYSSSDFTQSIDTSNLVNGKPIHYLINQTNLVINPESYQVGYLALVNCGNVTVERLSLTNNINGLLLASTNGSRIAMNTLASNRYGSYLWSSSNNTLTSNNITSNLWNGIHLSISSGNHIFHNNLANNSHNIYTEYSTNYWNDDHPSGGNYWGDYGGVDDYHGPNQDVLGNDGLGDIPYFIDVSNRDTYPLMQLWSSVPVRNIRTGSDYGTIQEAINANETIGGDTLFLKAGTYFENIVVNKTLSIVGENRDTTIVDGSGVDSVIKISAMNTTVFRLTIRNTRMDHNDSGIYLYNYSGNNVFRQNRIVNCYIGIFLAQSIGHNVLRDDVIANNSFGIMMSETFSDYVAGSNIRTNEDGIWLIEATNTSILDNDIVENHSHGIRVDSSNNSISHNNFTDNTLAATVSSSGNVWDNGYPSGGNYWSDYGGLDLFSGPYQTEAGADGLGDMPYTIDAYNVDNYPLTNPYVGPDLAGLNITTLGSIFGKGFTVLVNVTVENLGSKVELLNTTLYANNTGIWPSNAVILEKGGSAAFSFAWNTSSFEYGNYSLWAYVHPLQDEANTENNILTYGTVLVTIPGDVNGDLRVNSRDLNKLLTAYGARQYDPDCDIDHDSKIGPKDLNTLLVHYGQHYP